jgi:hypothetical protein
MTIIEFCDKYIPLGDGRQTLERMFANVEKKEVDWKKSLEGKFQFLVDFNENKSIKDK